MSIEKRILRLPAVIEKTGMSRSSIYAQMSAKTFPQAIKLSPRAIGWLESDINDWINKRITETEKSWQEIA